MSGADSFSQKQSTQASIWSGVENCCLAIISFASLIVYSRLLLPTDFGAFSMALAVTELVALLVTMLFHDALIQGSHILEIHYDTAFSFDVSMATVLALVSLSIAPHFGLITRSDEAATVFAYVSLTYPLVASTAAIVARQRRHMQFKVLAIRSMIGRGAGALAGILAAFNGYGIKSLILQQFVAVGVGSAILWMTCDRRPRCRFSFKAFMEMILFGAYSITALFLSFSVKRLFLLLAGVALGTVQAGYMNLGFRVTDMLWAVLATAATQPSLSVFSRVRHQPSMLHEAYVRSVRIASLFLLPCFAGIALTANEVVGVCFGPKWQPASSSLVILAILAVSQIARLFFGPMVSALGRPHAALYGYALQFLLVFVSMARLHQPSLMTVLSVWVVSELIQVPFSFLILQKIGRFSLRDQIGGMATPLFATLIMIITVVAVRTWFLDGQMSLVIRLMIVTCLGASSYIGAIWVIDRTLIREVASSFSIAFHRISPVPSAE